MDNFYLTIFLSSIALGALYSEKVKMLNIALEGVNFLSIFLTSLLIYMNFNVGLAIFISLVFNCLLGLSYFLFKKKGNIFIFGVAINFLIYFFVDLVLKFFSFRSGFLLSIENKEIYLGFFVCLFFLFLVFSFYLFHFSKYKDLLKIIDKEDFLDSELAFKIKQIHIIVSCALASLSGSFLVVYLEGYSLNMGLNSGWLGLAIMYVAFLEPFLIFFVSFGFYYVQEFLFSYQSDNAYFILGFEFYFAIIFNLVIVIFNKILRAKS